MRLVRRRRFVLAARAMGLSSAKTEWVHVLPHAAPALAVNVALTLPLVVSAEAALAFLELDQSASWGSLIVSSAAGSFASLVAVVGATLLSHLAAERAVRRLLPHAIEGARDAPLATPRDRSR
jgi:ABC-type dipeptide/oligopeptide/nickel transport system permease subunit